jgi:hypothetical protein
MKIERPEGFIMDEKNTPKKSKSELTMNALGDSLTHGDITGTGLDGTPWTSHIPSLAGIKLCRNYGVNGRCLALSGGMAERYCEMDDDADIISVFGGTNYFCRGVPIGCCEDKTVETFFGALNIIAEGLYKKYPGSDIFFITPPKCKSTLHGWEAFTPNKSGHILKDYRDAIMERADYYSIPVMDSYTDSGMSCYLDTGFYRPDGLHFTDAGYEKLAHKIAAFINTI